MVAISENKILLQQLGTDWVISNNSEENFDHPQSVVRQHPKISVIREDRASYSLKGI